MKVVKRGTDEYLTIHQIADRYHFPSYAAAWMWLKRRKHLIQPLRAGSLLYSVADIEAVMRSKAA